MFAKNINYQYKTAESVSPKHPDKIADQISDAILDAYLGKDPMSRVAVDVAGGHGIVYVTGEVTSKATGIDIGSIVKRLAGDVEVIENISSQSLEIAQGVDIGGAGDQGIITGYATNETEEKLPLEVVLSRSLNSHLFRIWPHDGKTQVTIKNNQIIAVVASFQHARGDELKLEVEGWLSLHDTARDVDIYVNPSGDWEIGGFDADAGLTGRKLAVDNYGPRIAIGGGAFSGKDPSKVDRSAAYMARRVALDYLKSRNAGEVFVRIAYAIGVANPLEATVYVDGVEEAVSGYDLSPEGIIKHLDLRRPIYEKTASYGHFGHNFSWDVGALNSNN
jgi:S-adenosylmethionine synthetase